MEIKHRYKNLSCGRFPFNPIKLWKKKSRTPLTDSEVKTMAIALRWFGWRLNRWHLISRLFLPNRSVQLLQNEFKNILADRKKADYFASLMLSSMNPVDFLVTIIRSEDLMNKIEIEDPCCFEISKLHQKTVIYEEIEFDKLRTVI